MSKGEWAIQLIKSGNAYVDDLGAEEVRKYRGSLTEPGKESPYRNRSVEENLDLFERMREGYSSMLHSTLSHRKMVLVLFLVVAFGCVGLYPFIGTDFFPQVDAV